MTLITQDMYTKIVKWRKSIPTVFPTSYALNHGVITFGNNTGKINVI